MSFHLNCSHPNGVNPQFMMSTWLISLMENYNSSYENILIRPPYLRHWPHPSLGFIPTRQPLNQLMLYDSYIKENSSHLKLCTNSHNHRHDCHTLQSLIVFHSLIFHARSMVPSYCCYKLSSSQIDVACWALR